MGQNPLQADSVPTLSVYPPCHKVGITPCSIVVSEAPLLTQKVEESVIQSPDTKPLTVT